MARNRKFTWGIQPPVNIADAEASFRSVIVLLPLATTLHVLEEWPRFPRWARSFASPRYTDREYIITHSMTVFGSVVTTALVWAFPHPWVVFPFLLFWLGPGVFCNALFHLGASVVSRTYCPGAVTSLLVYLPLSTSLVLLAVREQLLGTPLLLILIVLAPLLHALEVGHNVFKRW